MKRGLYFHLAKEGISKNKRLYFPYILTCSLMVMIHFILCFLSENHTIESLRGGEMICTTMNLGSWVLALFSVIFIFYTNSFLIKQRKKEFGLYNILGMGKWNISRIIAWETIITGGISIITGFFFGIVLSKFFEMGLARVMNGDADMSGLFSADKIESMIYGMFVTSLVFFGIFVLILLNSIRQIRFSDTVSLLKGGNLGEKPPKGNIFIGTLGVVILGIGYYLAITVSNPLDALEIFFIAVLLVIAATYLIMITGSVTFCRLLKENKKYYYKAEHFVSVSSMSYRMKRNGAGLATICILAIMVLVMISSTSCLYFGGEDSINTRYPGDINISANINGISGTENGKIENIRNKISETLRNENVKMMTVNDMKYGEITGTVKDGTVNCCHNTAATVTNTDSFYNFVFIESADYEKISDERLVLSGNTAFVIAEEMPTVGDKLSFDGKLTLEIAGVGSGGVNKLRSQYSGLYPTVYLVVNDLSVTAPLRERTSDSDAAITFHWDYNFDVDKEGNEETALCRVIADAVGDAADEDVYSWYIEGKYEESADFFSTYGGLFYLGIILSIVFTVATVLIIYYKQVTEGYEDKARFEIMQNVGMTEKEIKKSINSQLLSVFYIPLIFAGLHLVCSFNVVRQLLILFNLNNAGLFMLTTGITFAVFAAIYTGIYKITSNAYYKIVK